MDDIELRVLRVRFCFGGGDDDGDELHHQINLEVAQEDGKNVEACMILEYLLELIYVILCGHCHKCARIFILFKPLFLSQQR